MDWFLYDNGLRHERVKHLFHKQPPEVFCKKDVLRNFAKFTGKHLCQRFFFNKVAGIHFLQNTSGLLLLLFPHKTAYFLKNLHNAYNNADENSKFI